MSTQHRESLTRRTSPESQRYALATLRGSRIEMRFDHPLPTISLGLVGICACECCHNAGTFIRTQLSARHSQGLAPPFFRMLLPKPPD
ncbi:hypothetical protein DL93DRAFT_1236292 [Clavulina sp. PMI_390]|nr:hypothetical protein DL93DRAFT_1236292 [Clavulina sp. PMI_390]